ncbi:hypothetical protein VTN96DRAFT_5099 [Rasamsonia emersonii]
MDPTIIRLICSLVGASVSIAIAIIAYYLRRRRAHENDMEDGRYRQRPTITYTSLREQQREAVMNCAE